MNLLMIGLRCLLRVLFAIATVFRPVLGEIMDEHLYDDLIESIRVVASHVEGIIDTENIRKSGMKYHVIYTQL
jgi:divalent metal cation (Fe/Co/Zn/Cd) transporter